MAKALEQSVLFDAPDSIECQICLENFINPKILDCNHYFCEKCILNWSNCNKGRSIHCPTCWQTTVLPNGKAEGLREHVVAAPGGEVASTPNDKTENLRPHVVITSEQAASAECCKALSSDKPPPPNKIIERMCQLHTEELRFFCETCKESVCRECVVVDHLSGAGGRHIVFDIKIVARKADEMFSASIKKQVSNAAKIDREINKLVCSLDQVEEGYRRTVTGIDGVFNELEKQLKQKLKDLKDEALKIRNERNAKIESRLKYMTDMKTSELHIKEVCENALKSGKAFDKVELASSISNHCAGVRHNDIEVLSDDSNSMQFVQNAYALKRFKDELQTIGKINKSDVTQMINRVECGMSSDLERFATQVIRAAFTQRNNVNRAAFITNEMNRKYGCTWCCFIGSHARSCHVPLNFKLTVRVDGACDVVLFKIPSVTDGGVTLTEYTVQKVSSKNMPPNIILDAIDLVYSGQRSCGNTRNKLSCFVSTELSRLHGGAWNCMIMGGSYFWSHPLPLMYITLIVGQEYIIIWRS
ncbi:tripartite motif-containing protein 2-like [Anneissia japonica]|uniref:tripartite motif-containing protein 2-like n=1 Tax=Anneissia japonica TaxID=1529436 RepID=UPI0014256B48|nr:tripartite motif-containing protein 2-like [Anneissia japonica]